MLAIMRQELFSPRKPACACKTYRGVLYRCDHCTIASNSKEGEASEVRTSLMKSSLIFRSRSSGRRRLLRYCRQLRWVSSGLDGCKHMPSEAQQRACAVVRAQ